MKNRLSKTILVFFALGLISCALCVQQAQAVLINGSITFAGGVELDSSTVDNATMVTSWLDGDGNMPTVQSASGSFAGIVAGTTAVFPSPWSFNTNTLIPVFWTVDGFTFSLIASHIVFQGGGFLAVSGTGYVSGNGFGTQYMNWTFTTNDDPAGDPPVFSFSAGGETIPDGGATVALLGLSLAGIEGIRRKFMRPKS